MKRMLAMLCLLLALSFSTALAQDEKVTYGVVSVPKTATYVDLGDQVVTDWEAFYTFLSQLPELEKVDMFSTTVNKQSIEALVVRFPQLKFGWTIHIARHHYIRTDQTAFSTLHGSCPLHTSEELEVLKYCTELLALDIGHNDLTDISFLEDLTKLRVLILACNERLKDISVLSQLKDLEYIELFSCNIRDISALRDLEHLMDLNVSYNNLTKFDVLNEMTQLKRLWIPQSGVPCYGEAYKQLQADLPNTLIMNQGHPTNFGWREGNHFESIYAMFRANEYIPFEDSYPLETEADAIQPE